MAASVLSALLGFGREIIAAHYYGTSAEMDAYLNALTVPAVAFDIFNGALVAALVPTFSEYMSQGRSDELRSLGSTILGALFVIMTGLAVLGWFLAPAYVPVVAHGFPPGEQRLAVEMVRWLMPGIVATSLSGVCVALLNANHHFLASALIWVAANAVTIAIVIAFHRELGIFALVLGTVLGLFAQLLVQVPSIVRYRLYRPALDLRHPGIARSAALLLPVILGSGAAQINTAFDRYFASTLSAGSTAGLGYTTKLAYLPVLIVAGAIATVIFPLVAGQFANSDPAGLRRSISLALRMVGFIVIPCAAGLSALAYPIVQALFERGAFGPASTALCASLIPFACLPLVTISYNTVLGRICYACKKVRLTAIASVVTVAINIVLSATWLPALGAHGLLLANGVAGLILSATIVASLSRSIDGLEWKPLLSSLVRVAAASLVMVVAVAALAHLYVVTAAFPIRALSLAGLLAAAAAVYIAAAHVLRLQELVIVYDALRQKFLRP